MNTPTGNLFATPAAVATAARHMEVLRALAEARDDILLATPHRLAEVLGVSAQSLRKAVDDLANDGLVEWIGEPGQAVPTLTRQGAFAALGIGVATGEAEVDLDARLIEHARLRPNPLNPRKEFDAASIAELADNIEANLDRGGILQNLVVYPSDEQGEHVIFAGERRWRAVKLLIEQDRVPPGFRLPCRVREPDDLEAEAQTAFIALSENGQRQNLSMLEQARAYKALVEKGNLTAAEAARRTGRDKRTVQEMLKVLAEAHADAIAAFERGELKWEELRDSVKSVKLSPAQALIVLEVAARMDTEEAAAEEDDGSPPWIEAAFCPTAGPQVELVARGLLQFTMVDGVPLCRVRTDNPRLEGWLDATFGCEPGERRSLSPDQRSANLFTARTNALGSIDARLLEQDGKWATAWLNVEPPTIAEVTAASLADQLPDPTKPNLGLGHTADCPHFETKFPWECDCQVRAASAASQPEGLQEDVREQREPREQETPATADVREVREVRGPENAPSAQKPADAGPTPRQRMILAEILHKTASSPVKIGQGESGFVDGALIQRPKGRDAELDNICWSGWAQVHGCVGPDGEPAVRLSDLGRRQLGDTFDPSRVRDEARKDAGLSLAQRHELQQTGRYAWEPLNTQAPKPAPQPDASDQPQLDPETALALVELAAAIARDGQQLPGKPWRAVAVFDYHLDRAAGQLAFHKLAGWTTKDAQWFGYLTERGERWLKAQGLDPKGVIRFDVAGYREAAKVAAPEAGLWSSVFLNPKTAKPTGPAREAPEAADGPAPASAARDPSELFIWFGENNNIRMWKTEPFPGATRFVLAPETNASSGGEEARPAREAAHHHSWKTGSGERLFGEVVARFTAATGVEYCWAIPPKCDRPLTFKASKLTFGAPAQAAPDAPIHT